MTHKTTNKKVGVDHVSQAPEELSGLGKAQDNKARSETAQFAEKRKFLGQKIGLLGLIFGKKSEKPGNILGLVILFSFATMFFIVYSALKINDSDGHVAVAERLFSGFLSLVALTLGYLFGSNDRSDR